MIRSLSPALESIALALYPPLLIAQIPWPAEPRNLQVLPESTTAEELRTTMFSFSDA